MVDQILAESSKKSVLIVDDDPHILKIGCRTIRRMGFDALEASNLTEAVSILTSHVRINLVISDVQMPGGSGVELLDRMKQHDSWHSIPVALMTGGSLSNLPEGVLVLVKPFGNQQFRCVLIANLGGTCPKGALGSLDQLGACSPTHCDIFLSA